MVKYSKLLITFIGFIGLISQMLYINYAQANTILSKKRDDIHKLLDHREDKQQYLTQDDIFTPIFDNLNIYNKSLEKNYGLKLGFSYTLFSHNLFRHDDNDNLILDDVEIFTRWNVFNNHQLQTNLSSRLQIINRYSSANLNNISNKYGIISFLNIDTFYNEFTVIDFWLEQEIIQNKMALRLGKLTIYDYMNAYAFGSRNFYFMNDTFSANPGAVDPANGLGAMVNYHFDNNFYAIVGMMDRKNNPTETGFDSISDKEFIKAIELGYRSDLYNHYHDNYHIFIWQADKNSERGLRQDLGVSIVLQKEILNNVTPFIKAYTSSGKAAAYKNLYTFGVVLDELFNKNYQSLGLAASYGEASIDDKKEAVFEAYYKLNILPYMQLTPNIQIISTKTPANNSSYSTTKVFGVRFRVMN